MGMPMNASRFAEYDSVPGDCDSAIDYDSDDFDSHADIDYCYGLGEFGYVGEWTRQWNILISDLRRGAPSTL
jgi:hypothetical protein